MIKLEGNLYVGFDLGGSKISMTAIDNAQNIILNEKINEEANISTLGGENVAFKIIDIISKTGYLFDISQITFSVAGYSNEIELNKFTKILNLHLGNNIKINIMPDYEIFFYFDWQNFKELFNNIKNLNDTIRILLICGTGSVVIVQLLNNNLNLCLNKLFGYGPLISDPASGFDLGLKFLKRYLLEYDLGKTNNLAKKLLEDLGYFTPKDIINLISPINSKTISKIASFGPLLLQIAQFEPNDENVYYKDMYDSITVIVNGIKSFLKHNFKNYIDKKIQILFNGSILLHSEFYKSQMILNFKNHFKNEINFFTVPSDVSLICAYYSLNKSLIN